MIVLSTSTSQDVVDTAAMLVAGRATDLLLEDARGSERAAARLADEHRETAMSGRTLLQQAPPQATSLVNPFDNAESARLAGAKLYRQHCAECHGASGEGSRGVPPLKRPDVASAPQGALFWVLKNGSLRRGMPSFAHLPEPTRWQLVTYIRSLDAAAH